MGILGGCQKLVVALILGVVGLAATPAVAQTPPSRLLFFGISKDGRPSPSAENAVQLRLRGLDVLVSRTKELPPCDQVDCLAPALALTNADIAFTGRILKNEHACLAIMWLLASKSPDKAIKQEIVCRSGGQDDELDADLADAASAMIDEYRLDSELSSRATTLLIPPAELSSSKEATKTESKISWRKKTLIAGLGLLLAGAITTTAYFSAITPDVTKCPGEPCLNIKSFNSPAAAAGVISGALAASILFVSFR